MTMKHANTKWADGEWVFDPSGALRNWEQAHVVEDVVRWRSNGRVPFDDMLLDFETIGVIDTETRTRSSQARERDVERFLAEFRKPSVPFSAENLAEARAALGSDVDLVNVVTGQNFRVR